MFQMTEPEEYLLSPFLIVHPSCFSIFSSLRNEKQLDWFHSMILTSRISTDNICIGKKPAEQWVFWVKAIFSSAISKTITTVLYAYLGSSLVLYWSEFKLPFLSWVSNPSS